MMFFHGFPWLASEGLSRGKAMNPSIEMAHHCAWKKVKETHQLASLKQHGEPGFLDFSPAGSTPWIKQGRDARVDCCKIFDDISLNDFEQIQPTSILLFCTNAIYQTLTCSKIIQNALHEVTSGLWFWIIQLLRVNNFWLLDLTNVFISGCPFLFSHCLDHANP